MSSDLISREAVLKEICRDCHKPFPQYPEHGCPDPCYVYGGVSNLLAVDAVCVVRCKKCKWFEPCKEIEGVTWTGFCKYGEFHTDEDDFCSRGERRSE